MKDNSTATNDAVAIPLTSFGELHKLKPLAAALSRLSILLRPGRRKDRLMREFRSTWRVEHEYLDNVRGRTHGSMKCVDRVIFRDKELPPEMPRQAATPLQRACRDLGSKKNRRMLRAAGAIVGNV